ncbi:MAG TPA: hypothetical protein DDX92_07145 [Flavobacteriales bacterium]|jgi:tocopherol cyclase|nr:hypothetical protein [Flavobacteriales bacterium]
MSFLKFPYFILRHLNTAVFQGRNQTRNYFEGWYMKQVSDDGSFYFAVIPGIALDKNGNGHAFIQLIEGESDHTEYIRYELSDFDFELNTFRGRIGSNTFRFDGLELDLTEKGIPFQAKLSFDFPKVDPSWWISPGRVNWYSWLPGMQCYHLVVSPFHHVKGTVKLNGNTYTFNKGHGYIEKDYGRSFPNSWIWLQCNNFGMDEASIMYSEGDVVWAGVKFRGFICTLICNGKSYLFATYTTARVRHFSDKNGLLKIRITSSKYVLDISANGDTGGILRAPVDGQMKRDILETLHAEVNIKFCTRQNELIYEGKGTRAGFEVVH